MDRGRGSRSGDVHPLNTRVRLLLLLLIALSLFEFGWAVSSAAHGDFFGGICWMVGGLVVVALAGLLRRDARRFGPDHWRFSWRAALRRPHGRR